MGIKNLFRYLRPIIKKEKIQNILKGKTVAVDGMGWLYQAFYYQI